MKNRRFAILLLILACALVLYACQNNRPSASDFPSSNDPGDLPEASSEDPADSPASSNTEDVTLAEPLLLTLVWEDIVDGQQKSQTFAYSGESADLPTALLVRLGQAMGKEIGFHSVTNDAANRRVTVDFISGRFPASGAGGGEERCTLGAIAHNLLTHLDADTVYFTLDGGAFYTGHVSYDIDQPYLSRDNIPPPDADAPQNDDTIDIGTVSR